MSELELTIKRKQIDKIDKQILDLIVDRFRVVREIGQIKKELNLPSLDQKRFDEMLTERIIYNKEIDPEFVKSLFELIHKEAIKLEDK